MWGRATEYSIVPSLIAEGPSFRVRHANPAAAELLARPASVLVGADLRLISNPDDVKSFEDAVKACGGLDGTVKYLRHRFLRDSDVDVTTEMSVVGCGTGEDGNSLVLVQMRDASSDPSLAALMRLLAEDPDGDSVVRAIVGGPLARLGVRMSTVTVADRDHRRLVQLGSFGLDPDAAREYRYTPLDHSHPVGAAVLNIETVRMSMRSVSARYPLVAGVANRHPSIDTAEMIAMPVLSRGVPVGGFFLTSDRPMPRTWQFHETLVSISQSLAPWMLLRLNQVMSQPVVPSRSSALMFSDRERTIIRLVGDGMTNLEIADHLGYSEATVRADLGRMSKMLGVSGRREIVRRVKELGL